MATAQFEGDDASLLGQQKTRRLIETAHGDFRVQPRVQKVISNKIDRRLAQQIFDPNTPEYVKATDEDEEENLQFRRVLTNSFFKKGYDPEFLTHRYVMDQWSTTKVITSGKLRTASILVIVGDGKGCLGWGIGKHVKEDVAMELAWHKAERNLFFVDLHNNEQEEELHGGKTILVPLKGKYHRTWVTLRPAGPGGGLICGQPMGPIARCLGLCDMTIKIDGRIHYKHIIMATLLALSRHRSIEDHARQCGRRVLVHQYPTTW